MEFSADTINELFLQKLDSKEGLDKVAQTGSAFIRQKLREVSFARKVINPVYVTQADLQRSVNHDGLVKIVDIEPDSKASVVNFRGKPDTDYIAGERYEIPFFAVSSDDFQKTEEELLAYEMPLTEVIEKNSVKDIQAAEDQAFIDKCDAILGTNGQAISESLDSDLSIKKSSFVKLFDVLDGQKLKTDTLLMNSKTYNKLLLYLATTAGDTFGTEVLVNGYTYSTLFGKKLVVTNKTDIVGDNKVYAFTAQEYFGNFFILNDTKFWIQKQKNIVSWAAYETIGMGIGNVNAVARLDLS